MKRNRQLCRRMRQLCDRIRPILNTDWDPIGVGDVVSDEYDSYIPTIARLLHSGANAARISDHLLELERTALETTPDAEQAAAVAKRLLSLLENPASAAAK